MSIKLDQNFKPPEPFKVRDKKSDFPILNTGRGPAHTNLRDSICRQKVEQLADHVNKQGEYSNKVVDSVHTAVSRTTEKLEGRLRQTLVSGATPIIQQNLLEDKNFLARLMQAMQEIEKRKNEPPRAKL